MALGQYAAGHTAAGAGPAGRLAMRAAASPRGAGQLRVAKQLKPPRLSAAQASWADSCSEKPEKRAR